MKKTTLARSLQNEAASKGLIETIHRHFGTSIHLSIGFSAAACATSVDEFSLSVRAMNALKRSNLFTVSEVIDAIADNRLEKIRNLGRKSINEIKTKLLVFGYERLSSKEQAQFFADLLDRNEQIRSA